MTALTALQLKIRHGLPELLRFGTVTAAGFVIDLGIAWTLAALIGVPVLAAAAVGFTCAVTVNYLLHETWTFRHRRASITSTRAGAYGVTMLLVLAVRLGTIALLTPAVPPGPWTELILLIGGASVSFAANYALSRAFLFSARRRRGERSVRSR